MTQEKKITVKKQAYLVNDEKADKIRRLMKEKNKLFFNIMGSIGAGKTLLLERITEKLSDHYKIFVINGDVATTIDADRIAAHGATTVQINTGGGCHLNANLIQKELDKINIDDYDIFFAENVGNLICPAAWDVGAQMNIVVVSITEGEYVIKKHPIIFKGAEIAVINKCDLDGLGFDSDILVEDANKIKSGMEVICTSAKTSFGLDALIKALGIQLP
ncbi:MAG: hydrogenase nickel incorporation protein HypB [Candidatus Heimdallarchaeota archaeon]|nr:hydrogenase nickel incorporation protein HypB [Candidatus Heimdallarchaeota archaeon]MCG3254905.1 hydrogenase nickel incorporation protein HypB [Candidatus Heimdallarchaeota archaeon]MCK4609980.1 hydrogenase nickel incorporation protein HypB [Candidatus Heimdallarchaeota archaeon]